jgi:RHS repeat-associated protein
MWFKAVGLIASLSIFASVLVATPATAAENQYKAPEGLISSLPDAPLVETLNLASDQAEGSITDTVKLTATTNAPVEATKDKISIHNKTTNEVIQTCETGAYCEVTYNTVGYADNTIFYATTTNFVSEAVEVINPAPALKLKANPIEGKVELKLDANPTLPAGKRMFIANEKTGKVLASCDTSKACATTVDKTPVTEEAQFAAYIAEDTKNVSRVSELQNVSIASDTVTAENDYELVIDAPAITSDDIEIGTGFVIDTQMKVPVPQGMRVYTYDETRKRMLSYGFGPEQGCSEAADYELSEPFKGVKCIDDLVYEKAVTYRSYLAKADDNINYLSTPAQLTNVVGKSAPFTVHRQEFVLTLKVSGDALRKTYQANLNQNLVYLHSAIVDIKTSKILQMCDGTKFGTTSNPCYTAKSYSDVETPEGVKFVVGKWSKTPDNFQQTPYQTLAQLTEPGGIMHSIQASTEIPTGSPVGYNAGQIFLNSPNTDSAGGNPSKPCDQTCVGDPVNAITGEFWINETDVKVAGSTPLQFTRNYSISKRNTLSDMGYGWNSNYAMSLKPNTTTSLDTTNTITVSQENGSTLLFTKNAAGGYSADLETRAKLTKDGASFILTRNNQSKFIFNNAGTLTSIVEMNGDTKTLTYANGKLATVKNSKNQQLTFTWDAAGLLASVTTPEGKITKYGYSSGKNLNKITYPDGTTETFVHNGEHMIMDFFDRNGNKTTNTYNADKKVTAQIDPLLNKTIFEYAPNVNTITYPNGRKDKHYYNNANQTSRVETAAGTPEAKNEYYYRDAAGNLTSIVYDDKASVEKTYDANGNPMASKIRGGETNTYTYNAQNQVLTETNAEGQTRTYAYDAKNNLVSQTDFKNNTTAYTVNADNTIQKAVSPTNAATTVTHNAQGLPITSTNALNETTQRTLSLDGLVLTTTDPKNQTTTNTYDATGRITKITYPNSSTETNTYDGNGNITETVNRAGETTKQTYDALNRPLVATDALNRTTSATYDKMGNPVSTTDASGKTSTATYNLLEQKTSVTDANGNITKFKYDINGNVIETIDPNGKSSFTNYDANNNVIETVDASGVRQKTSYNDKGLPETTTDAQGNVTSYQYDANNNRTKTTFPNASFETSTYDANNNQLTFTDSDNKVKKWTYDALNRSATFTNTNNGVTTYAYDANGNTLSEVRPGSITVNYEYTTTNQISKEIYADATTEFIYDAADRLIKEKQGVDEVNYTYDAMSNINTRGPPANEVAYTYTVRDEIASMTYPSGKKITYTYDNNGNMLSGSNTNTGRYAYEYNNMNSVTKSTTPNTVIQNYTYNATQQLLNTNLTKTSVNLYNKEYSYQPSGLVGSSSTTLNSTDPVVNETYAYDNMARLSSNTSNATTSGQYAYTNTGNMTKKLNETQTFNTANNVTASNVGTDTTYGYSASGHRDFAKNTAGVTTQTYAYNKREQLIATRATNLTSYAYDANGLIKRRTQDTKIDKFVWDYNTPIPRLLDDGEYEYIYTNSNTPVAQIKKSTNGVTYLHAAENGSVVAAMSNTGAVLGAYTYTAYGDIETPKGSVDLTHALTRFGYAGEWKDPETGLYNLRARWYEPKTGTFLTRDPVEQQTNEAYSYASGNPLLNTDPLGLWSIDKPLELTDAEFEMLETGASFAAMIGMFIPVPGVAVLLNGLAAGVTIAGIIREIHGWMKDGVAVTSSMIVDLVIDAMETIPSVGRAIGKGLRMFGKPALKKTADWIIRNSRNFNDKIDSALDPGIEDLEKVDTWADRFNTSSEYITASICLGKEMRANAAK